MNTVRKRWTSEIKEQQEHGRKANSAKKREDGIKRSQGAVHVAINETRPDQDSDL